MNKNKLILFIIVISIIVLSGYLTYRSTFHESYKLDGFFIYDKLGLNDCFKIEIFSNEYVEDGRLKGEDRYFEVKEEMPEMREMLQYIKIAESKAIKVNDFIPGLVNDITHSITIYSRITGSIQAEYSIEENKLIIVEDKYIYKSPLPKAIIIEMDEGFKEVIISLSL